MYGAILGDIIGSRFEFDRGGWTKDFELFTPECAFTDDSVMTVAIAEAMGEGMYGVPTELKNECLSCVPEEMKAVINDFGIAVKRKVFVEVKGTDERAKFIDMLEKEGLVISEDAVRTKQEIIEAVFPLIVNIREKNYDMMGNATCAAAAVSCGALVGADDIYRLCRK